MIKTMRTISVIISTLIFAIFFAGCYTPSPIYGTWTDNDGSKITFMADNTFNSTINDSSETPTQFSGEWTIIDNVLILKVIISETEDYVMRSEWDIRGAMLYMDWTLKGVKKSLILYHTAR